LVWWQTFSLLYLKADQNLPAGLGSWLAFSSHWWGHHLASSPSHPNLEMGMKSSQPNRKWVDIDLVWLKTFSLLHTKAHNINFGAGLVSWLG
jgi:hypothetical protein